MLGASLGCAQVWVHPSKGQQEWYADYSSCEAQAGQASSANDQYGIIRARVRENCLRGKGWVPEKKHKKQTDGLGEAGKKWVREGN